MILDWAFRVLHFLFFVLFCVLRWRALCFCVILFLLSVVLMLFCVNVEPRDQLVGSDYFLVCLAVRDFHRCQHLLPARIIKKLVVLVVLITISI